MSALLFPDNTVLNNFGLVSRVDLFAELVDGRGAWTNTIAEECAQGASREGLESLSRMPEILGKPFYPTRQERIDTLSLRARLAAPGDRPSAHLGEAETIAIMLARQIRGAFVTDDRGARRLAQAPDIQIPTYTTADLFKLAVRAGKIDADTCWEVLQTLRHLGRRIPAAPGARGDFDHWLKRTAGTTAG
jgi:predicted nucleic acid-binding protein